MASNCGWGYNWGSMWGLCPSGDNYPKSIPQFDTKRNQYTYPSFFVDPTILNASENINIDKWFIETNRPRFDVSRRQYLYPNKLYDILNSSIYVNPSCAWGFDWGYDYGRCIDNQARYKFVDNNQPIFDVKRLQYTYPNFFIDALFGLTSELVTTDKWFVNSNIPIFDNKKTQYTLDYFIFDSSEIISVEQNTLDKWFVNSNIPIFYKNRNSHLYSSYHRDVNIYPQGILPAEMESWWSNTNIPKFDKKKNQYLYPSNFRDPIIITPSIVIKWRESLVVSSNYNNLSNITTTWVGSSNNTNIWETIKDA